MNKPLSWIDRERRRGVWTAVIVGWAFLGIPLALVATKIDGTLGWIALGVATAPFILMAFAATAFILLAPFFARKPSERLIVAPISFFIGYAIDEWRGAVAYLAAVLIIWAAVSAFGAFKAQGHKVRVPS